MLPTHQTCSPRTGTGAVSFKKSPNTRFRATVFVNDGWATADWPCATHAIETQHRSCTDSCNLLFDRDFNNQLIVVWNFGVGRLEKNLTISTHHKTAATTRTTADLSNVRTAGVEETGGGGGGGGCKSGCILGRAPGIQTNNCVECCVDFFGPNSQKFPTQIATTFFTLPGGCRLIIFSQTMFGREQDRSENLGGYRLQPK